MNRKVLFIFKNIFEFFLISFTLFFSKIFFLNYIWGSFNSKLTLFQSFFSSSFLIFFNSSLFYIFFQFLIGYNIFLKIPTLITTFYFYFLNKNSYFKYIGSLFFFIFYFFLIINPMGKEIYWYGFGWLISAFLIFIPNLFIKSFVSIWASHAVGTLIQIYFKVSFLTKLEYKNLLFISWIERIILSISLFLSYKLFLLIKNKIDFIIKNNKKDFAEIEFKNDKRKN